MNRQPNDNNLIMLNVGFSVHSGDWNWKDIESPFTRIYLVTKGTAQIQMPDGLYTLRPGHLYCIPSFVKHTSICSEEFEHYYMHLYEENIKGSPIFEDFDFPFELPVRDYDEIMFRHLCAINPQMSLREANPASYDNNDVLLESIHRNKSREYSHIIESRGVVNLLVAYFLHHASPRQTSTDNRISQVLSLIRRKINEPLELDDLVQTSCMSRDYFIKVFHRETGDSPMHYIIRRKIERAQLLLVSDNQPVKQIAFQLGYFDYSYFNRLFKKEVGLTPIQYRQQFANAKH